MNIDINIINKIARQAGSEILKFYDEDRDIEVSRKSDDSPLTKADMASHRAIVSGLEKEYPEIPVLSEESEIPDYSVRKNWNRYFLIDPLDGTKEFIKKNGEFTVNIALIDENEPVLGVVYIPAEEVLYFADAKEGSFKQVGDGPVQKIEHARYSKDKPARIMVSRSHRGNDTKERLAGMGIEVGEEIPSGSSLKICFVAEGKADLYPRFGPTMEWDTAAADAVYRYSGKNGPVKSPLKYNKEDLHNPEFIIGL
ncbi:3'(2'),5'-bisphosphate nucleotidase [Rhodohalobacter sp. SW132]|uniref:3'(2'),5'-bisphosphate nucleotidase CysQ n=1 Tax=Rhodohalobacter sp. SW132 TaxID=2293433 RepID=UPI000E257125|nr:3'(2'),5'-bisphosphate nucleotidase CysQ [Rhodohalobacter sp. SW132]REL24740.1 3'(2'),5'-bisphosphate nucleotidase [Rhodohalobacter sp. SW132]